MKVWEKEFKTKFGSVRLEAWMKVEIGEKIRAIIESQASVKFDGIWNNFTLNTIEVWIDYNTQRDDEAINNLKNEIGKEVERALETAHALIIQLNRIHELAL